MFAFVHAQNLLRYMDRRREETDPEKRQTLHALLIEEEDRFGAHRERTGQARLHVEELQGRIARQDMLISRLQSNDEDARLAEELRNAWLEPRAVMQRYAHTLGGERDA